MERLSAKKKVIIVRQYLSGMSYDEIAAKCGVSKGTVANVVTELKAGVFPEAADVGEQVELLRELSVDLKRSNLTPGQCAVGLAALARISECGLNAADIKHWPLILKSAGSEEQAREFVKLVYSIEEVQHRTGLSLDNLDDKVHELEKKAAELEPMARQHDTCTKELANLATKREELAREVAALEQQYKLLNPRVKDLEKREQDLSRQAKDMDTQAKKAEATLATLSKKKQRLLDIGLSVEALGEFSERLGNIAQRHHIAAAEFKNRLLQELESLDAGLGLKTLVQSRQKELEGQEHRVAAAKQEEKGLKAAIDSLRQEKAGLEASIRNTREKVGAELAKMVPVVRGAIDGLIQELRRGHDDALVEVRRLMAEAVEAGKQIGRVEETLRANNWLTTLLSLNKGDENVEANDVRSITLLVLRGVAVWIRQHKANDTGLYSVSHATDSLVKEMEQWKV